MQLLPLTIREMMKASTTYLSLSNDDTKRYRNLHAETIACMSPTKDREKGRMSYPARGPGVPGIDGKAIAARRRRGALSRSMTFEEAAA